MKVISFILSLYFAMLLTVPCCAFDNCPDDKTTEQTTDHQPGDKDNCGTCSPFFNCESCASVTINSNTISFTVIIPGIKQVYPRYISPSVSNAHYDFWQPPRIA
ncbi:MAG: DUF6660 family protein [Chitinophagaceae bacterium]